MDQIPSHIIAALDQMLVAIGRWQADPTMKTWEHKLAAIRDYLVVAETDTQYVPATRSSLQAIALGL